MSWAALRDVVSMHPELVPSGGAGNGMTTGPGSVGGAIWIWAAVGVAMPATTSS